MRRALWATSRWRLTAIARRQKPAKRPCLAGGRPRSSRARFLTSWKARVASGPHLPDSSNASGRKLCLPGSTNGSYSLRLASSLRRAATQTDSYDRCLSTLVKQPASVVVTSRSRVRPKVGDSNVGTILGCRTGGLDGETVGGFHNSLEPSAGTERTEAARVLSCGIVR